MKKLQQEIDKYREAGVEINVSHAPYGDGMETTISIADNGPVDCFTVEENLAKHIPRGYDSGYGFGYRDMQLCEQYDIN